MQGQVENTFQVATSVANFLNYVIFNKVRAGFRLQMEDVEKWLRGHGYTIPSFITHIFAVLIKTLVIGLVVDAVALIVGTWWSEFWARVIIVLGTLVAFSGFVPLLILKSFAGAFYELALRGGEAVLEVLDPDVDNDLSERLRRQLREMVDRKNLTGMIQGLYAAFAAMTVAFLVWPNVYGFYGLFVGAIVVSGVICLRMVMGVKGHGVTKLTMAGAYGFTGGAIVFVLTKYIAMPFLQPVVPWQIPTWAPVIAAAIAAAATFLLQLNMRIADEEEDVRKGDVRIKPHKLKVADVDPATGKPKSFAIAEETKIDLKWLSSNKIWVPVVVVAAGAAWFFLGQPNPFSGGLGYMNSSTLLMLLFVGGAAIWLCRD